MATNKYLDYDGLEIYDELIKGKISDVDTKVGDVTKLETTAKTDIVNALNEVRNSVSAGGTEAATAITEITERVETLEDQFEAITADEITALFA